MATGSQNNRLPAIDHFIRHRVDRQRKTTAAEKLYSYWEERGGRQQVTGLNLFHVFKVKAKGWDKGEWFYDCQWVGYSPKDNTWEPEAKILSHAPAAVEDWEVREAARKARVAARKAAEEAANQEEADEETAAANP
ncbi:hypothetical protein H9Q73_004898 [Fusarium xylarioides]|nr:hypothetical protein H9Q73_004898 [Fusarium xylarioides]